MSEMKWWFVADAEGGWKSHFFPDPLKDKILKNLEERGMKFSKPPHPFALKEITNMGVDAGGACHVDEPFMEYSLDSVTFSLPVTQVETYLSVIRESPERSEIGTAYYKICGEWHCVCLRPEDREELIKQIELRFPEAQALTEIENLRWNKFVDDAQEEGVSIRATKRPTEGAGET